MPQSPYRFVFLVRLKEGCTQEQYVDAWGDGSMVIQREPGALGTKLYRIPGTTLLLAVALWESKEARDAAAEKLGRIDDDTQDTDSVTHRHKQFGDTYVLDEIASVDPPQLSQELLQTGLDTFLAGVPHVSSRAIRSLELGGKRTVEDLIGLSAWELTKHFAIGNRSLSLIRSRLDAVGLALKGD